MDEYYVCLIDLLGQKEFFYGIKSCSLTAEQAARVEQISSGLREMVKYVENRYGRDFNLNDNAGIELFSDSLILSLKATDDEARLSLWFRIICKLVYIALRHKLPLRGVVVRGPANRVENKALYGIAVEMAFKLEQTIVDYPRIVVEKALGKELMNSRFIAKYLDSDTDSSVIVNYAGERLLVSPEFSKEKAALENIVDFVGSEFSRFCNKRDDDSGDNAVLARRYHMWLEYLRIQWYRLYDE